MMLLHNLKQFSASCYQKQIDHYPNKGRVEGDTIGSVFTILRKF